jgi:ubiquinone/menaquinone biosynthesis C-methylase UbiE
MLRMNESYCFDRAAGYYDQTRELPETVATAGIQAILTVAGEAARILDVGTGTGRISVPLLTHGADLVGCDLSLKMMGLLRQKFPLSRLAQADASQLPFPAGYFDALLTCHVMHLVGPWRQALREYRRVLKPAGVYINAYTERIGESIRRRIREFWEAQVASFGSLTERPGARDDDELRAELAIMGAGLQKLEVVRFSRSVTPRGVIQRIADRTQSSTWYIPDEQFEASLRALWEWAADEFDDLDHDYSEEAEFVLDVARFSG